MPIIITKLLQPLYAGLSVLPVFVFKGIEQLVVVRKLVHELHIFVRRFGRDLSSKAFRLVELLFGFDQLPQVPGRNILLKVAIVENNILLVSAVVGKS